MFEACLFEVGEVSAQIQAKAEMAEGGREWQRVAEGGSLDGLPPITTSIRVDALDLSTFAVGDSGSLCCGHQSQLL
jgi:hypothetical protein